MKDVRFFPYIDDTGEMLGPELVVMLEFFPVWTFVFPLLSPYIREPPEAMIPLPLFPLTLTPPAVFKSPAVLMPLPRDLIPEAVLVLVAAARGYSHWLSSGQPRQTSSSVASRSSFGGVNIVYINNYTLEYDSGPLTTSGPALSRSQAERTGGT